MGKCVEKLNRLDFTIKTHKFMEEYSHLNNHQSIIVLAWMPFQKLS